MPSGYQFVLEPFVKKKHASWIVLEPLLKKKKSVAYNFEFISRVLIILSISLHLSTMLSRYL